MTPQPLHSLIYVSTATAEVAERDVSDIVETAQFRNGLNDVTGLLLYNGRNFLQLLEGAPPRLFELMGRLALDPRHVGLVRLVDRAIAARACPDWTMRRLEWLDPVDQRERQIADDLPDALEPRWRELILNFARLN